MMKILTSVLTYLDENKEKIKSTKISEYLARVEKAWLNSHNVIEHQAGFCAQWCLDNSCKNIRLNKLLIDESSNLYFFT